MGVEKLADNVMELFKKNNCKTGDILIPQWICGFRNDLNPAENEIFGNAIHHLESLDYIKIEGTPLGEQYRLLQAGYDHIYRNVT